MRLTPTTRLVAVAVLLTATTAIVWWAVGFPIGSALLDSAPAWRKAYAYSPAGLVRLLALAITVPFTAAVVGSATPQSRWLALAGVAFGAVILYGDRSSGDMVAVVLLVLGAAAMTETSGTAQIVVALAISVLIVFAALSDIGVGTFPRILATLIRAVFFYAPLLLGPVYLERYVLKRIAK